jgi:hypothetical protein
LTDLASNLYPVLSSLPLKLLSFSGSYLNQKTSLNWETASEQNLHSFEIQRSSNGTDYTTIGTKAAAGNNIISQNYQFTDDLSAVSGSVFFYRLKMIDQDGQFRYSNVIAIHKETSNIKGITINPNPVINGMATVRFTALSPGNYDSRVIDASGKIVLQQQNKISGGNNSISIIGMDRLLPGIYVLQVSNGGEIQSIKFITR